jgi:periplasmic copper chaperone A
MRSSLWRSVCWVVVLSLSGALCAAGTSTIEVSDPWIRWLPAGLPAGGYATLHNGGVQAMILSAVSSPDYGQVSLHRSSLQQGNNVMQSVAQITIPARSSLNFATAGYHIMLLRPTRALQPGDRVPIALRFADGSSLTVMFDVRRPDAGPATP